MKDSLYLTPEIEAILTAIGNAYTANTKKQRLESFTMLNRLAEKNAIVLVGDSITEGFPIHEMYRSPIPIYNRGIGGDTSRDVLGRLEESVFDLEPCKVFLLIGTNDLAVEPGEPIEEIARRIQEICTSVRMRSPQTDLYLLSVFPVTSTSDPKIQQRMVANRTNKDIQALNGLLERMASGIEIPFIDMFSRLVDLEGQLQLDYTIDGLHLSVQGYEVVLSILKEYLE